MATTMSSETTVLPRLPPLGSPRLRSGFLLGFGTWKGSLHAGAARRPMPPEPAS